MLIVVFFPCTSVFPLLLMRLLCQSSFLQLKISLTCIVESNIESTYSHANLQPSTNNT